MVFYHPKKVYQISVDIVEYLTFRRLFLKKYSSRAAKRLYITLMCGEQWENAVSKLALAANPGEYRFAH
jgi:hypothetical protein